MRGYVDHNIDVVVKFGGSLLDNEEKCIQAIKSLEDASKHGYRVMVVPGGGPTDNTIERLDKSYHFDRTTHHRACALAQDQTGIMICDKYFSDRLKPCKTIEEADEVMDKGFVAVMLPSNIIFGMNPFEKTWDITSDGMAAWFAWVTAAKKFVLFKSVMGIYDDYKSIGDINHLVREINAKDLIEMGANAVDACVAPFLIEKEMDAYIIDGSDSDAFLALLNGTEFCGTRIIVK